MKYIIEDTDKHTLGEINDYFKNELMKTSLNKEDIIIDASLKMKIGTVEIERILDENLLCRLYEIKLVGCIHLKLTGHTIELSNDEINSRFEDAYSSILSGLKEQN